MNIYFLEINADEYDKMPYGRTDSLLIEAEDEYEARRLAYEDEKENDSYYADCWLDADRVDCEIIKVENRARIIHLFYNRDA